MMRFLIFCITDLLSKTYWKKQNNIHTILFEQSTENNHNTYKPPQGMHTGYSRGEGMGEDTATWPITIIH